MAGKRTSLGATSVAGSTMSGRSPSTTSRSHVPSLTSHAFFHPMSSQKLQAQRGAARQPPNLARPPPATESEPREAVAANTAPQAPAESSSSNPITQIARPTSDDSAIQRPPPSRGSEMTGQETLDRITANTSPTHGHYPAGSLSESVRPLQQKKTAENKNLSVRVDKSYKSSGNLPTPVKSPRSFRSSFLLPTKGDSSQAGNRKIQGGEKLDSVSSTPQLSPTEAGGKGKGKGKQEKLSLRIGRNFEYFEGNTVFFLGGRWQNSRSSPVNIATAIFFLVPSVLFFIFSAPWLWHNVSPAIPIVFAYLFYICSSSFWHASVSDPGVSSHVPSYAVS
jgi:palmitoyltransferase ZDHHC9/14/18